MIEMNRMEVIWGQALSREVLLREYAGRSETRSWLLSRGKNGNFFGGVLLG